VINVIVIKRNIKRIILIVLGIISLGILVKFAYAAFTDKGTVLGSSFSVGNADIKLLLNPSLGTDSSNLFDEINGPAFTNVGQNWSKDYPIKIFNNGTYKMSLVSHAGYETSNDPEELRQYIYAEIFNWTDVDYDGEIDSDEIKESLGKKTIVKWKTEGYSLGEFEPGEIKSYVVRFSTESISDTKQGASGSFDFEFDSIEV